MTNPKHHSSSLPATGPGSTYCWPIPVVSLPKAAEIAEREGTPLMCQIVKADGVGPVGKMHPNGTWEVAT